MVIFLIVVPLFSILPSARQRQQMEMRRAARAAGVSVDLMTIDDPNPGQDKYISHAGQIIPARLQVAAYRIRRPSQPERRLLPKVEWCLKRELDGSWAWVSKELHVSSELKNFLDEAKDYLPEDVEKVEESYNNIVVYWHERAAGSEENVLNFLQKCAEMSPFDSSSQQAERG